MADLAGVGDAAQLGDDVKRGKILPVCRYTKRQLGTKSLIGRLSSPYGFTDSLHQFFPDHHRITPDRKLAPGGPGMAAAAEVGADIGSRDRFTGAHRDLIVSLAPLFDGDTDSQRR